MVSGHVRDARRRALPALTGLRFFAAALVLAFHTASPHLLWAPLPVRQIVERGFVGVSLFFVLSGFILAHVYLGDLSTPAIGVRQFYRARFARVYPAYAAALLFALPVFIGLHPSWRSLAGALITAPALLQSWHPATACRWNCPGWSLSVEAFFYATFPFLGLALARLTARGLWRAALTAAVAAVLTPTAYVVWLTWAHPTAPGAALWLNFVSYNPLVRLPEFALGVAAGRLWALGRLPRVSPWWPLAALAAILAVGRGIPHALLETGGLAVPFALLVASLASAEDALTRALSRRWLVVLGEASYSLYLFHVPLHDYFDRALTRVGVSIDGSALWYAVYLGGSVLLSLASLKLLEQPARRWLLRLRRGPSLVSEQNGAALALEERAQVSP